MTRLSHNVPESHPFSACPAKYCIVRYVLKHRMADMEKSIDGENQGQMNTDVVGAVTWNPITCMACSHCVSSNPLKPGWLRSKRHCMHFTEATV